MSAQATFAATLVDEWARCGVRHAVIAPGSRSAPLVLALDDRPDIELHVRLDERSAAFFALGIGLAAGVPAVFVTTSGTAAAEAHAAVVEASYARVPLIVCTADRPPELQGVGAPQTIDQNRLFGTAPRLFVDPGVADSTQAATWRPLAGRVFANATAHPLGPGPVHVNLPFREPLVERPGALPPPRHGDERWLSVERPSRAAAVPARLVDAIAGCERGLLVAGAGSGDARAIYELGAMLGWPVLADPRVEHRLPDPVLVTGADSILACEAFAEANAPGLVVRVGAAPASRRLARFVSESRANLVVVEEHWPWRDPDGAARQVFAAPPADVVAALVATGVRRDSTGWLDRWAAAEAAAQAAIDEVLAGEPDLTEPALARSLYSGLNETARIFAGSSMPIRDLEWFAGPSPSPPGVLANRGANGIDGVASTALGAAAADPESPLTALVGDLGFLHDLSALVWGDPGAPPATIVVVDNSGGGIFSFLPQATALERERFERLFGTPQSTDLAAVGQAFGYETIDLASAADLDELAATIPDRLRVALVRTDRAENAALHAAINARVGTMVDKAVTGA